MPKTAPASALSRRPRNLAQMLVDELTDRVRSGRWAPGTKLPTEAEVMREFGVSRTVVREAISRMQAGGLTHTRHGIGTFVTAPGTDAPTPFRITAAQLETLNDVISVLELRIALETEAAALAAERRTDANLEALAAAQSAFLQATQAGEDAVSADLQFHLEIARTTGNNHFVAMLGALGSAAIPRARLAPEMPGEPTGPIYLEQVHAEHQAILAAIAAQDAEAARAAMRTHLVNSRERRRRVGLASQ